MEKLRNMHLSSWVDYACKQQAPPQRHLRLSTFLRTFHMRRTRLSAYKYQYEFTGINYYRIIESVVATIAQNCSLDEASQADGWTTSRAQVSRVTDRPVATRCVPSLV